MEEGTKQMLEERFIELLHQEKTYNVIRTRKSSRNEKQSQATKTWFEELETLLLNTTTHLTRYSKNILGASAEYLKGTCPYKIFFCVCEVYISWERKDSGITIMLFSKKHLPNISVLDEPQMVTSHGNKIFSNML